MKAFPTTKPLDSWDDPNQGMDLRDYFASKSLSVLYKQFSEFENGFTCSEVADASYRMADAMMKAREQ
jgi:hypothetical protein